MQRAQNLPPAKPSSPDGVVRSKGGDRMHGAVGTPDRGTTIDVGGRGRDRVSLDGLRSLDVKRPSDARDIREAGAALGYAHDVAVGASLAAVGGIYATPYRGGAASYYHGGYWSAPRSCFSPWGFSYYGGSYSWSLHLGWGYWGCSPWYWPTYLSCWYPIWYCSYRPYWNYYYPTAYETVVYRTVYVDNSPSYVAAPTPAPAVQQDQAAAPAPAPAKSATATASDRYVQLGDQAFRDERYTDAVQLYAKAIEFNPDEGALYMILADALFASGDYHYGAYAVRRGLELDHSLANATVDKHDFYPNPSRFDEQLAVLETYVLEHPYDRDARLMLAINDLFGGRPAAAVDVLETDRAATLRDDPAAQLILDAARSAQYGASAGKPSH